MQTFFFDNYLTTIADAVDRVTTDDFGVICETAEWNAEAIEKALHERHKSLNLLNRSELYKELVSATKTEWQGYINSLNSYYIDKTNLSKDVFADDSPAIERQMSEVQSCLRRINADSETKENIMSSYAGFLTKCSCLINEFFSQMKQSGIVLQKTDNVSNTGKYDRLLALMHGNEKAMRIFLARIEGKKGAKIAVEIETLVALGVIDESDKLKPIHCELVKLFGEEKITKYKNWTACFYTKHKGKTNEISKFYTKL